jgi:hypothetical protein
MRKERWEKELGYPPPEYIVQSQSKGAENVSASSAAEEERGRSKTKDAEPGEAAGPKTESKLIPYTRPSEVEAQLRLRLSFTAELSKFCHQLTKRHCCTFASAVVFFFFDLFRSFSRS